MAEVLDMANCPHEYEMMDFDAMVCKNCGQSVQEITGKARYGRGWRIAMGLDSPEMAQQNG